MFYAVNSLLILKGLSSSKHSGVRGIINREFVKTGIIEDKMGKFYSEMFNNRQEGDYKDFVKFNYDDVALWIRKAEDFISRIEELVITEIDNK